MTTADPADLPDLTDCGKTPIAPDAPAGSDASYDPDYEALQREIDKLSLATAARASLDWNLAARLAANILVKKSKDIKVAAYLAEALTRTGQIAGLATGVHILRDLVETYWEALFPPKKRLRGRLNALDWWQERARAAVEAYAGEPLPAGSIEALKADLIALDTALVAQTAEATPLHPLIEAVANLPVQADEPVPDSSPAPAAEAPVEQAAPPAPAAPSASPAQSSQPAPAAGSVEKAREQFTAGLDALFGASAALWQQDPASPLAYRLVRLAAWLPLTAPPPATNGKTMLPPPPAQLRTVLDQGLTADNALAVIGNVESRVREFRFWLDLSRKSVEALRSLGPAYAAAVDGVETETALLLRRFPGLDSLTFVDGSPFADAKTRLWLGRIGQGTGTGPSDRPAVGADSDEVAPVLDSARKLATSSQTVAAVSLLQGRLETAPSGRLRLRWRIGLAEILLATGHPETARPVIDLILEDLDAHQLDAFDPELTVTALRTARQGLAAGTDEASQARAGEVLDRIMRLDPAQGLRLSGIF